MVHKTLDVNKNFYDRHWGKKLKSRFMYDAVAKRNIMNYVLQEAGFVDGGIKVLDIGFGSGLFLLSFDRSDRIAGIELSEQAILYAKQEARRRGFIDPIFIIYDGVGRVPFPDESFDLIICSHVLEHVPDDRFLLGEIYRMCKPHAKILLNIPINEDEIQDPRHIRKYHKETFIRELGEMPFSLSFSYEGDRLWSLFGWFFEREYHKNIPVFGYLISAVINVGFSSLPFALTRRLEQRFLKHFEPRQLAVFATKSVD